MYNKRLEPKLSILSILFLYNNVDYFFNELCTSLPPQLSLYICE